MKATSLFGRATLCGAVTILIMISLDTTAQIQLAWVARYSNGITNGANQAVKMALDSNGNIIVTGFSQNTNNQLGYVTIKYAPNGTQLWAARYDSTTSPTGTPEAMAIDASNCVIVTGSAVTIKYDSNGNQLWTAPYAGTALATDSNVNVYVAGFSKNFGTAKLTPQGSNVWLTTYVESYGKTVSQSVLVDRGGNVYVSGLDTDYYVPPGGPGYGPYVTLTTIKYSSNGTQIWKSSYAPIPQSSNLQFGGAALDSADDLYLMSNWPGFVGYFVTKYSTTGSNLWSMGGNNNTFSQGLGFALDATGNLVVTGEVPYQYTGFFSYYYGTCKINSSGSNAWSVFYPNPGYGTSTANSIAVDSANNCYITGFSQGTNSTNNIVTIKYGSNGNQLWLQSYNGLNAGNDAGNAIAVDKSGNVYVTGYETLPGGGTGIVTIKYAPITIQRQTNGTVLIETQGSPGESFDIQASSDLLNWLDLGTFLADTNGLLQFDDTNAPNFPARFYYTNPQ